MINIEKDIIHNKNYNAILEDAPVMQIINMLDNNIAVETIFMFIECDYGVNKICRLESYKSKKIQTILDVLLFHLKAYHEFDDITNKFYSLAELVLLLIQYNAKCARDLPYNQLIADYNIDSKYLSDVKLAHQDGLDTYKIVFEYLSIDNFRFKYLRILKQNNANHLNQNFNIMLNILLTNRNYSDPFDANNFIQLYDNVFGLEYKFENDFNIKQLLINYNLTFLYQSCELYPLYKKITELLSSIAKLTKAKLREVEF
jgi:hypothetical protein